MYFLVYGKSLQNVRNYIVVKIHLNNRSCQKAIQKPTFRRAIVLNKKMVLTVHAQEQVFLDKPFIVGQTILDLSKYHMYDFWYNHLLKKVSYKNVRMLMSDTGN